MNEYVLSPEETFNHVTGLAFDKRGDEFLNAVQAYEKNIRLQSEAVKEKDNFSFDYFFNQAQQLNLDDEDSSSDEEDVLEDDNDEDYTDLTDADEHLAKSVPNKTTVRKQRISKHST